MGVVGVEIEVGENEVIGVAFGEVSVVENCVRDFYGVGGNVDCLVGIGESENDVW